MEKQTEYNKEEVFVKYLIGIEHAIQVRKSMKLLLLIFTTILANLKQGMLSEEVVIVLLSSIKEEQKKFLGQPYDKILLSSSLLESLSNVGKNNKRIIEELREEYYKMQDRGEE